MNQLNPLLTEFPLCSIDEQGLDNALNLARAARLAYAEPTAILQQLQDWGFAKSYFLNVQGTQGYVARRDDAVILAFRGTEAANPKDWLTNLQVQRVAASYGEVHEGFWQGLNWVWPEVATLLQLFRDRQQPLFITGHSLGGALATLAAAQLHPLHSEIAGVYTFGAPRVGDRAFAEGYNAALYGCTFRFVNDRDIVPRVPLASMGYVHSGQLRYFDPAGTLQPGRLWSELPPASIVQDSGRLLLGDREPIQDHDIALYESHLANLKGNLRIVA